MAENKEIDIIGLTMWFFGFVKRYFLVIFAIFLLGAGAGAIEFYASRNYYKTTLVATSPIIDNQIVYELIDPVKYYVANEMYDSISDKFDIKKEVAMDIREIELDTSLNQAVKIELQVYNSNNVILIQQGLMHYLNNIPFISSLVEDRRSELNQYIKEINKEIEDLNSMQEAILDNIQNQEGAKWVSSGNMFSEMMALNDRKLELMTEYNSLEYFKVINSNVVFEAQKSLKRSIIIFSAAGLVLGILFSIFFELLRLMRIRRKTELATKEEDSKK